MTWSAFCIDHCALGGWFGEHSQLPESVIEVMRCHHEGELSEQPNNLVSLVAAADHMANHLQRGEPIEEYDSEENPGLIDLSTRWNAARKERFLAEIPDMMETARRASEGE